MAWYPPSTFEGSDETLLNSNQTRQFLGDVSAMWIFAGSASVTRLNAKRKALDSSTSE